MQHTLNKLENNEDLQEEWTSFCSSCKSVLRSMDSVGIPSNYDELFNESTEENDNLEMVEQNLGVLSKKWTINDIKRHELIASESKRLKHEEALDKIVRIDCTNDTAAKTMKLDEMITTTANNITPRRNGECTELPTVTIDRTLASTKCDTGHNLTPNDTNLNTTAVQENAKEDTLIKNDSFFASSLFSRSSMSSTRSRSEVNRVTAKNILDRRRNVLKICNRLLKLSNCVNNMQEIILEEVRVKDSVKDSPKNINKVLSNENIAEICINPAKDRTDANCSENLTMYNYNPWRINNKKK